MGLTAEFHETFKEEIIPIVHVIQKIYKRKKIFQIHFTRPEWFWYYQNLYYETTQTTMQSTSTKY
jgi:hypothetical protein